jgi:hypothetical protein
VAKTALLIGESMSGSQERMATILDHFAIPWRQASPASVWEPDRDAASFVVIGAASSLARVLSAASRDAGVPPLLSKAESVFLYGLDPSPETQTLCRRLGIAFGPVGGRLPSSGLLCRVQSSELSGPMAGLSVRVAAAQDRRLMKPSVDLAPIVACEDGVAFGSVQHGGGRYYLTCDDIVDIARPVEKRYFDVADHFLTSVPVVMYLRHSFRDGVGPQERGACIVVDDPVLRPAYGFLNFANLAALALEYNFSLNVAFIPWNWSRSKPSVVDLFKHHSDRLSISIHGCDHGSREFAETNAVIINTQTTLARTRMDAHATRTGLGYDSVMVFPQGAFSTVTPGVLKRNNFLAAVNTDVSPTDLQNGTEIRDTWQTAITRYSDFPILTRRYAWHGLHNFAFDLLLGKPCLIVTHHGDFVNGCADVMSLVHQLKRLPINLKWRPLGDVVRHACQMNRGGPVWQVRMFGRELVLGNEDSVSHSVSVSKVEHDADAVERVEVNGHQLPYATDKGEIRFDFTIPAGARSIAYVQFKHLAGEHVSRRSLGVRSKVAVRRYLSELRDESQARAPLVYEHASKAALWLSRVSRAR